MYPPPDSLESCLTSNGAFFTFLGSGDSDVDLSKLFSPSVSGAAYLMEPRPPVSRYPCLPPHTSPPSTFSSTVTILAFPKSDSFRIPSLDTRQLKMEAGRLVREKKGLDLLGARAVNECKEVERDQR